MSGEVAEWLMAAVLKTAVPERVSGVRIPPSPPTFAHACQHVRELRLAGQAKVVRRSFSEGGPDCRSERPAEAAGIAVPFFVVEPLLVARAESLPIDICIRGA